MFEYNDSYKIFDNYDVSFHNELWASTFGGCFAAGTSWAWERVFWWDNALPQPPIDPNRPDGNITHTSGLGDPNTLFLGLDLNSDPIFLEVVNRTLQHHFAPLNNFLSKPSIQALGLFTGNFTPRIVEANGIECFYLINEDQDLAVGWVHNASAYWDKAVYITNQHQRYLACTSPSAESIDIDGFMEGTDVFITYFPTRVEMTEVPSDAEDTVEEDGLVTLNLAPALFNGIFPQTGPYVNHLDTLHSDYAFVVATWSVKSLAHIAIEDSANAPSDWDYGLFPNPARNEFFLRFQNDAPKSVALHDLSGRMVRTWGNVSGMLKNFVVDGLSNGAYWVRVTDGANSKTKKLLIH